MKRCLQCNQFFDDETNFCLSDGSALVSASGSFHPSSGEMPTVASSIPFIPPLSAAAPPAGNGVNMLLVAAVVGLLLLLVGGGIAGLVIYNNSSNAKKDSPNAKTESTVNASKTVENSNDDKLAAEKEKLKEQQDKLAEERQKLENERKSLEEKKKETPKPTATPKSGNAALVFNPPSNVRAAPNGTIICVIRNKETINVFGTTSAPDGIWYYTDACGRTGVIHAGQLRF